MRIHPEKFREIVFLVLFAKQIPDNDKDELVYSLMQELRVTRKIVLEAWNKAVLVEVYYPEADAKIGTALTTYSFDRVRSVEKILLRLACFEINTDLAKIPKVALAEAARLAKKFSTEEAANFVGAVLEALYTSGSKEAIAKAASQLDTEEELGKSDVAAQSQDKPEISQAEPQE